MAKLGHHGHVIVDNLNTGSHRRQFGPMRINVATGPADCVITEFHRVDPAALDLEAKADGNGARP